MRLFICRQLKIIHNKQQCSAQDRATPEGSKNQAAYDKTRKTRWGQRAGIATPLITLSHAASLSPSLFLCVVSVSLSFPLALALAPVHALALFLP